jgi:hypothetical protein
MTKLKSITKFNIFSMSKNKTFKNNVVLKILSILFLTALSIIILYALYHGIRKVTYMYRLKHDFYKLKDIGVEIQNFNIVYCEELKRKWTKNPIKVKNKKKTEFKNKNSIGMISDKYVVLDFDTKDHLPQANFILDMIPKDTAYEKTPNGYHYYFENDTGKIVKTRIQVTINGIKYALDVLGNDSLVYMSPTCINGKDYYWINSIFTHKPAKLSENMWIFDIIKDTKPFYRMFDSIDVKLNITNALIIVNSIYIESQVRFVLGNNKQHSKKIKYLNGYIYVYDDNYYFLTNSSFNKIKNKTYLLNKMRELVVQINPSCIIDLSIINSNYYKPNSVLQISSAVVDNSYKNYKNITRINNYVEINKTLINKTKYLIQDTITITNLVITTNPSISNQQLSISNKHSNPRVLIGNESIYISLLLSSEFNIPNTTLGIIEEKDTDNLRSTLITTSDKIFNSFMTSF